MDLRVDSTEDMVETFLTRKSSYLASADDMKVEYLEVLAGLRRRISCWSSAVVLCMCRTATGISPLGETMLVG